MKSTTKAPSVAMVRTYTKSKEPFFFAPKTLKMFGQKISEMKVLKSKKNNDFWLIAPVRRLGSSSIMFYDANRIVMSGEKWYFASTKTAKTMIELKKVIGV
jgi:hypothetical protein